MSTMERWGHASQLWVAAKRGTDGANQPEVFMSLSAAVAWCKEHCNRFDDYSIYVANLDGHVVQDEPRWVNAVGAQPQEAKP